MKNRRHDQTGRSTGQLKRQRHTKIEGPFVQIRLEMLESSAMTVLCQSARKVLDRMMIEHMSHAGTENGNLPVTYDNFVAYGIHRHSIAPALRELEALGFIEITHHGRAGNAEYRSANKFRLTFLPTPDAAATDEWKRIEGVEEAKQISSRAREARRPSRNKKNRTPVTRSVTETSDGFHHSKSEYQ